MAAARTPAAEQQLSSRRGGLWVPAPLYWPGAHVSCDPMPLVLYTHWLHAGKLTFIINPAACLSFEVYIIHASLWVYCIPGSMEKGCRASQHIYTQQLQHLAAAERHQQRIYKQWTIRNINIAISRNSYIISHTGRNTHAYLIYLTHIYY